VKKFISLQVGKAGGKQYRSGTLPGFRIAAGTLIVTPRPDRQGLTIERLRRSGGLGEHAKSGARTGNDPPVGTD
jgi:hypothetical protein